MRSVFLCLLAGLTFLGCKPPSESRTSGIDSLLSSQVHWLSQSGFSVTKSVRIGGLKSDSAFIPASSAWGEELDIFKQIGLYERPSYRSVYSMTNNVRDKESNLSIRSFKTNQRAPVRIVRFYYFRDLRNLKKIEAVLEESNSVFFTRRNLQLVFDDINGKPLLTHYTIAGVQKTFGSDSVHYRIDTEIHSNSTNM